MILLWLVKPHVANAAMSGKLIQPEDVDTIALPASCLDENVCIQSCRKYFTSPAWEEVQKALEDMKKSPVWYCGRCKFPICDEEESSIICDCCLLWFHFKCVCLKQGPKSKIWFCRSCHAN